MQLQSPYKYIKASCALYSTRQSKFSVSHLTKNQKKRQIYSWDNKFEYFFSKYLFIIFFNFFSKLNICHDFTRHLFLFWIERPGRCRTSMFRTTSVLDFRRRRVSPGRHRRLCDAYVLTTLRRRRLWIRIWFSRRWCDSWRTACDWFIIRWCRFIWQGIGTGNVWRRDTGIGSFSRAIGTVLLL